MTCIIDYGVGNLFSLLSSLHAIGEDAVISSCPEIIEKANRIILPGVGAFCDASRKLKESGLVPLLSSKVKEGIPFLGICLGMQLLFEKSFEYGEYEGLGFLEGEVRPISESIRPGLKIPHMGWNSLIFPNGTHPLFQNVREGDSVYFVHSYSAVRCDSSVIATCDYGGILTAAVAKGNVMGCQFHPEKSGNVGLSILKSFCEMEAVK